LAAHAPVPHASNLPAGTPASRAPGMAAHPRPHQKLPAHTAKVLLALTPQAPRPLACHLPADDSTASGKVAPQPPSPAGLRPSMHGAQLDTRELQVRGILSRPAAQDTLSRSDMPQQLATRPPRPTSVHTASAPIATSEAYHFSHITSGISLEAYHFWRRRNRRRLLASNCRCEGRSSVNKSFGCRVFLPGQQRKTCCQHSKHLSRLPRGRPGP
jgi:hypothetical protein